MVNATIVVTAKARDENTIKIKRVFEEVDREVNANRGISHDISKDTILA